ncbi:DUF2147 domain-containing protein [Methylobacterium sp. Leaf108]|uniref:DUF2147 domain-containing protein n=1 Tax=Methylobacterium sp. Leaf108 TaxID=1736256 RepID=UPI000AED119C
MNIAASRRSTYLLVTAFLAGLSTIPANAADPSGTWLTEDRRARVRTERCGPGNAQLCGYIVWGSKPLDENGQPRVDRENPDPQKRTRLLLGHQVILGLKLGEDGRYGGQIYNGDNGKSYTVTVWSEEPSTLSVKGCLVAVLCQTQTWTRVTDVVAGQLKGPTNGKDGPRSDR